MENEIMETMTTTGEDILEEATDIASDLDKGSKIGVGLAIAGGVAFTGVLVALGYRFVFIPLRNKAKQRKEQKDQPRVEYENNVGPFESEDDDD